MYVLALLLLLSVAARPAFEQAPMGGMVFLDQNRNGQLDEGEPGIGGVNFTANCNDETIIHFYSEPRTVDQFGNVFATGTYGPVLSPCDWVVTIQVPDGYTATTPTQQVVTMLGPNRGSALVYFGLYGGPASLPDTGMVQDPFLVGAAAFLGVEILGAAVLGLIDRRRS
jgi:hypothetical protein